MIKPIVALAKCCWTNKTDGSYSNSKLWTTIANGTATYVIIVNAPNLEWPILLVYMAIVGSSELAKRVLEQKYSITKKSESSKPQE